MNIHCIQKNILEVDCDALVINLFEGVTQPSGATGAVNSALSGLVSSLIESGELTGKLNETVVIHTHGLIPAKRVIVVGLGNAKDFNLDRVRQATGASVRAAKRVKAEKVVSIVHGAGIGGLMPEEAARCVTEGAAMAEFSFDDYKTESESRSSLQDFIICELDPEKWSLVEDGRAKGIVLAEMTNAARKLVTTPANDMTPSVLAAKAQSMAEEYGFSCEVLDSKALAELGMNALLGVGKGSIESPMMVVMKYEGATDAKECTALVGKGMTFDSGGISIKPADGMQMMKDDMGGAAAVICALAAITRLKLKVNIMAVAPLAENMPCGSAQKPGDVIKSMSGKTIEILNTDAEGRLILADAVHFAGIRGASRIIDVATLTGSVVVALGHEASGYISNSTSFSQKLDEAAAISGEKCWRLPIYEEYKEYLKSDIADLKNTGGRPAGAITGGMFIGEFAGEIPWIHLDIAGTVWTDKDLPYIGKGATGVGVRTLTHLAELFQA